MEQAIERLWRRLQMMVGRGVVTAVDDSGPVQLMQVRASGLEVADRRVRPQEFGLTSNPPVGSDAALAAVSGDRSSTMVVGVNHQGVGRAVCWPVKRSCTAKTGSMST